MTLRPTTHQPTRRVFVRDLAGMCAQACAGAPLAFVVAGCAAAIATRVTPVDGRVRLRVADHPQLVASGGSLRLVADGVPTPLFVLVQPDGQYLTLSSECTHRGCTIDARGSRLVCPCHGSTYDRTGAVLVGPAERPLQRFATRRLGDGVIEIELGGAS